MEHEGNVFEVMGNVKNVWWIAVEITCRIFGLATATVMCAVGVETVKHEEFSNLGIYLLMSSVTIMVFEMAYFLDALLVMCLPCPPDWPLFVFCGKMAHIGAFYKFLYYAFLSLVCFLHPVLLWHAVVPGIMLVVTAVFNLILSKKVKNKSREENDVEHGLTGKRGSPRGPAHRDHCVSRGEREESIQAMLEQMGAGGGGGGGEGEERRRLTGLRGREEPVEREMMEMGGFCESEPDTTSDTAPMITD